MDKNIGTDLTVHLANQIQDASARVMALTENPGDGVGIVVSACMMTIDSILNAYVDQGCPKEIITTYRKEVAARILGEAYGSIIVSESGVENI